MSIRTDDNTSQHTLKIFDEELGHLHGLLLEMSATITYQLEQLMLALHNGEAERAENIVLRDQEINQLEIKIDAEVLTILARHAPVANDLRGLISTTKISEELEGIGDEICECAKLVIIMFDPRSRYPNPKLLADLVKIGDLVKRMLNMLHHLLEDKDSVKAYRLLDCDQDCEAELRNGIKRQLDFVIQDARLIGRSLDIMHIMKSLERCGEYCRTIAEHMIYMIDGVDIRHTGIIDGIR